MPGQISEPVETQFGIHLIRVDRKEMADFDEVKEAFVDFIENVPFYGLAVMCIDHAEVQNVIGQVRDIFKPPGREIIHNRNVIALRQEFFRQVAADKACAARNQCMSHDFPTLTI